MTTNVLNLPGDYKIKAIQGKIVLDTPLTEVLGDTVLGTNSSNTIEANAYFVSDLNPATSAQYNLGLAANTWLRLHAEEGEFFSDKNVENPYGREYDSTNVYDTPAHRRSAAVYLSGGMGIEKDLNVGGYIYGRIETATTSLSVEVTSTNIDSTFYLTIVPTGPGQQFLYLDNQGTEGGLSYNPAQGRLTVDRIRVANTETSFSSTSGALTVAGGVGIKKNLTVEQSVSADELLPLVATSKIGSTGSNWAEAYVNNIYTKLIGSTEGDVQINPASGVTDVLGDLRVRGNNPIGTAPVVTNILYVTMDGNDTNDGRAMDSSRACRTIGGALNSPYYQPGTQIRVAPGHYLEDNPLQLKPYTSIMGSDIRTTSIEPINKTQDLFHLNSGCYLAFMQFLNGRSGLLEGSYAPEFNRGAYCTAFPPLEGDERIDLFHSPYVQNCTNLSGPWLKDGTMFVPNQTVQLPYAVGTGTWVAGTTTIVVNVGDGVISQGMSINAGQQNPGFFNARTLMLANKPFIQEQVVKFVDDTFTTGTFVYDQVKCSRDIGLIVDSIATDLLYQSESESIFAGLQYWRQSGYVDAIGNQITTTTAAISYVNTVSVSILQSNPTTLPYASVVASRFTDILTILNTASNTLSTGEFSQWITDSIIPNGAASTDPAQIAAYDELLAQKEIIAQNTIDWILVNNPGFNFNTGTCYRDILYMIDSVAFDLLHGGNKQSIKSGVYYYGYSTDSSEIPAEIPQTTAAYDFIKSLMNKIVTATTVTNKYQTLVPQVVNLLPATNYEVEELESKIDLITGIIRNGPESAPPRVPINLTASEAQAVLNAHALLVANRDFIRAETIAYINAEFGKFEYSREYCYRDVGILVENIAYDAAFGGNQKAVESGLAYYDGVVSKIAGQETQTIAAIDYLNQLCQTVITNTTATDLYFNGVVSTATHQQVRNTVLLGGEIASDSINNLFNIVTDIISNGPDAAPPIYTSTGPDAAFVSAEILMQANREFIQEDTINYINNTFKQFPFSTIECKRDIGLIIDAIAQDLVYPTPGMSQSTFAGLQYWRQDRYTGDIESQVNPTVDAITYLKELSAKIIRNITPADDLINRYQTATVQVTTLEPATAAEVSIISANFNNIIEIVGGNNRGWTDRIIPNGKPSTLPSVANAYDLLLANKDYLADEVAAFVDAKYQGFSYDTVKCKRDVKYMVESVAFDLLHGGNRQAIQSGLYYYGFSGTTSTIHNQETQTVAAFNRIKDIIDNIVTNTPVVATTGTQVQQVFGSTTATVAQATELQRAITTITDIIVQGPSIAAAPSPISLIASTSTADLAAYDLLMMNKEFIKDDVINFINWNYNPTSFNYNEELCYRDVGLIIDAVSQDILLGGNYKSIEAGLAYWTAGYNYVSGQETTTTMAINYARDLALEVIANRPVVAQTGTEATQIINTFFQYGGDYMPQEAVKRNFGIITKIIQDGPLYAPPRYMGGGLFALTGINGADVLTASAVTSVSTITTGTYLVGLSQPTVGFGNNATLYFGPTSVYPLRDTEVESLSLELTGSTSTWNQRKVDPIGSMGGSLVDGAVISERSPIQSFVYDAFTQLTQGGRGIHITNDGYAQLVSVFTIFCSRGVEVDNGGIASVVNSNANFGDLCLIANGYGKRKFTGHIYNPTFKSYPESPDPAIAEGNPNSDYFDQYYPSGFWPNNARVRIFLPDVDDRAHISLVMEVVPPEGHVNEQGFPGFLAAAPTTSTLTTSSLTISGIDTDGIAVGHALFVRDQFGRQTDDLGNRYIATGTVVTEVGYRSVTLSKALNSGGSDPSNTASSVNENYFDLYFCGNNYYTVLSSEVSENPKYNRTGKLIPPGVNILSTASTGLVESQVPAHVAALRHLNTLTNIIISNNTVTSLQVTATTVQTVLPLVAGGEAAQTFIDLRFSEMINIIEAPNLTAAEAVIKPSLRTKSGPEVQGAGSAITLIRENIEFLADEIAAYVEQTFPAVGAEYNSAKCQRDVKIILQRLIYDLETGGRYNSVMTGLSYWNRPGTYHIVQLGENVTRTDLFPDGATVNFYQRSYISASGYVFEYVGAGTNYGALPQVGKVDPVQSKEVVQINNGKVFFTSTDQNGDFRIGPGLVISQATGVLSGRTFTKSLFANMTPFILAIESGGA